MKEKKNNGMHPYRNVFKKGLFVFFVIIAMLLLWMPNLEAKAFTCTVDQFDRETISVDENGLEHIRLIRYRRDVGTDLVIPSIITDGSDLIRYQVDEIGENCFSVDNNEACAKLTSITLPDTVSIIGNYAFEGCSSLTTINFTSGLKKIGDYAFVDCSSLKRVELPDTLESLGNNAFDGCSGITYLKFCENTLSRYRTSVFVGCTGVKECVITGKGYYGSYATTDTTAELMSLKNLETLTVGEGITEIPVYFCYGLKKLTTINLPSTITKIGDRAFSRTGLTSINLTLDLQRIGEYAFAESVSLKEVYIASTETMGGYAFSACTALETVYLDDVPNISLSCFEGCTSLTDVTATDSLKSIGGRAFKGCTALTYFEMPDSVNYMSTDAFRECSNLKKVVISSSLTEIPDCTFYDCVSLTDVVIPDSISTIGSCAFYQCTGLQKISFPSSVYCFESSAFWHCTSLKEVYIPTTAYLSVGSYCFVELKGGSTIYVGSQTNRTALDNPSYITQSKTTVVYQEPTNDPPYFVSDSFEKRCRKPNEDVYYYILFADDHTDSASLDCYISFKEDDHRYILKPANFIEGTGFVFLIPIQTGNGSYDFIVTDGDNNTTTYTKTLIFWDNTPPTVSVISADENTYQASLKLTVSDGTSYWSSTSANLGELHTTKLFAMTKDSSVKATVSELEAESITWDSSFVSGTTSISLDENGTYTFYTSDSSGNLGYATYAVDYIDRFKPSVSYSVSYEKNYALLQVTVLDDTTNNESNCVSGFTSAEKNVSFDYGELVSASVKENTFYESIVRMDLTYKLTEDVSNASFLVYDNAGNYASTTITTDIATNAYKSLNPVLDISYENINLHDPYPAYTNGSVKVTLHVDEEFLAKNGVASEYDGFEEGCMDNGTFVGTNELSVTVSQNQKGAFYVKNKGGYIFKKEYEVTNIDTSAPVLEAVLNNTTITVNAIDVGCGVQTILIDGGTMSTIKDDSFQGAREATMSIKLSSEGTYTIQSVDMLGNVSSMTIDAYGDIFNVSTNEGRYVVSFTNYNGAIVKCVSVEKGADATPPDASSMIRKGYVFTGWDIPYCNVQENLFVKSLWVDEDKVNTYIINYVGHNNAIIKSESVKEGGTGTPPSKEAMAVEGQVFLGWNCSYANVHSNTQCIALYIEEITAQDYIYTVCFFDNNNAIVNSQTVRNGQSAIPPSSKDMERDGYVFVGWDVSYCNITAHTMIHGVYLDENVLEQKKETFLVNFISFDNAIVSCQKVEKGEDAVPPSKSQMVREGYTFAGWSEDYADIRTNKNITAIWKSNSDERFTVNFLNEDGSVITSQSVEKGGTAIPPSETLLKKVGYTFVGFDTSYANVQKDTDCKALYVREGELGNNYFVVNFVSFNGAVIKSEVVAYGGTAMPPQNPTREGYIFIGWDKPYAKVTEDFSTNAMWVIEGSDSCFVVDFIKDGAVLSSQNVLKGGMATPPSDDLLTKAGYVFLGWDTSYYNVQQNLSCKAVYARETNEDECMVSFVGLNGVILDAQIVSYGQNAVMPKEDLVQLDGYTFVGWDSSLLRITEDKVINALYRKGTENGTGAVYSHKTDTGLYSVSFISYDGAVVKSQTVSKGQEATPPDSSVMKREGYVFLGWDIPYSNVREDLVVNAVYQSQTLLDGVTYVVDFYVQNAVVSSKTVKRGETVVPPEVKNLEDKTFIGWSGSLANVCENKSLHAVFADSTVNEGYTVVFAHDDGTIIKSQTVKKGADATPPSSVNKEGYSFVGWNDTYTNITGNKVVTAVMVKEDSSFVVDSTVTVVFKNYDGSVISAQSIKMGGTATPPTTPKRQGYTFTGWSNPFANVLKDTETVAMFISNDVSDSNVTTDTSSPSSEPAKYITITEFKDNAMSLPVFAQYDSVQGSYASYKDYLTYLDSVKVQEKEGEDGMALTGEPFDETKEGISSDVNKGSGAGRIISALVLVTIVGAVGFYFLNKKYYWVVLPF